MSGGRPNASFPLPFQNPQQAGELTVAVGVSEYVLWCTLTSAFEGGASYWMRAYTSRRATNPDARYAADLVLLDGALEIVDTEDDEGNSTHKRYVLDRAKLQAGVAKMARLTPRHFADMAGSRGDATTGDVLLQLCLFDKVMYG